MNNPEDYLKLCYIDEPWAYFTTQALDQQWGDDWDDAPYEHNAGEPYDSEFDKGDWQIIKVAYDGDLLTPNWNRLNSPYSVLDININQVVPWLQSWKPKEVKIYAGASLHEFIEKVNSVGGCVYLKSIDGFVPTLREVK